MVRRKVCFLNTISFQTFEILQIFKENLRNILQSKKMYAATFTKSKRNRDILVDKSRYEYRYKDIQKNVINPTTYWECREKDSSKCPAKAKTVVVEEQVMIKELIGTHTHSSQILRKKVRDIENAAVVNASNNPNVPIRTTLANITNSLHAESDAAASSMSSLKSLQMKIYRARSSNQPKLPKNNKELLDMPEKYCKLDSGEEFLVAAEEVGEGEVVLVFLSDFGARVMSKSPVWVADGTFKCVPPQFGQLYVVHGSKHNSDKLFPACYCLLPNKQSETYLKMFNIIKSKLSTDNNPRQISIDFEAAAALAIREAFPNTQVDGCNFHWKKCIFENVGNKGCLSLYHNDEHFQVGLDLIYALCLVPENYVIQVSLYVCIFTFFCTLKVKILIDN